MGELEGQLEVGCVLCTQMAEQPWFVEGCMAELCVLEAWLPAGPMVVCVEPSEDSHR